MPEFISLLRWVRDTAYPQFQTWLTGAQTASTASSDSALDAKSYANEAEDVGVKEHSSGTPSVKSPTEYSALHYSEKAKDSAILAEASEDAALISESNANDSAVAAASSETNAGISETASALSEVNAQLRAWEAEAEQKTADSYATELEDVPVKIYTSNANGTFTATDTNPVEYSSLHWRNKAQAAVENNSVADATDVDFQRPVKNSDIMVYDQDTSQFNLKHRSINDSILMTIQDMGKVSIDDFTSVKGTDIIMAIGQQSSADATYQNGLGGTFDPTTDVLLQGDTYWNSTLGTVFVSYYDGQGVLRNATSGAGSTDERIGVAPSSLFVNTGFNSVDLQEDSQSGMIARGGSYDGQYCYFDPSVPAIYVATGEVNAGAIVTDAEYYDFGNTLKCVFRVTAKALSATSNHSDYNSFLGVNERLIIDSNLAVSTTTDSLTALNTTGISLGASGAVNPSGVNLRYKQTNYGNVITSGTIDGKFYLKSFNPVTRRFIVWYEGSNTNKKLPLEGKVAELVIKDLGNAVSGKVFYGDIDYDINLFSTNGSSARSSSTRWVSNEENGFTIIGGDISVSADGRNYIAYGTLEDSPTDIVVQYVGNGGSNPIYHPKTGELLFTLNTAGTDFNASGGSYIAFVVLEDGKVVNVTLKRVDSSGSWVDSTYAGAGNVVYLNATNAETSLSSSWSFFNPSLTGSTFNQTTDDANLNLAAGTVWNHVSGMDEGGYIINTTKISVPESISLAGVSNGLKWIAKKESDGTYVFLDSKPIIGGYTDLGYEVREDGKWYIDGVLDSDSYSWLYNPVFVASETPAYIDYDKELPKMMQCSTKFFGKQYFETVSIDNLPTSDPFINGELWNDANTIKISSGA